MPPNQVPQQPQPSQFPQQPYQPPVSPSPAFTPNPQPIPPQKHGFGGLILGIIIGLVVAAVVGGWYMYSHKTSSSATPTEVTNEGVSASQASAVCDNYQCLIAAAKTCTPITATIAYSGRLLPFLGAYGIEASGHTQYSISNGDNTSECSLAFTDLDQTFTMGSEAIAKIKAQGATDDAIAAQLKSLNDDALSAPKVPSTCLSDTATITAYLTDVSNNYANPAEFSSSVDIKTGTNVSKSTITTSGGQNLICTAAKS